MGGPTGMSGGAPARGNGLDQHAEESRSLRNVPDRQREPAAGGEYAGELRRRLFWAAQMQQDEVSDERIEGPLGERQRLGVAGAKLDLRMKPTSERDHRVGDVDPDDRRSPFGCLGGHIARPGGDVQ